MKSTIRIATIADLANLLNLEHACFTSDLLSKRSLARLLQSKSAGILVIEESLVLMGLAIILFRKNSSNARLYSFAIHKDYRNKGLAALLHNAMEEFVKKNERTVLTLEVDKKNKAAISFYEKHGYQHFGMYHKYYQDGADALRMKKTLSEK